MVGAREIKGHLKLELKLRGEVIGAFGPDMGGRVEELSGATVDLVGRIKRDHWRGGNRPEILLMHVERRLP